MGFLCAYHTDAGIKKKTNQDSFYVAEASTAIGPVFFALVCDGMGGLSEGELASSEVCKGFAEWFRTEVPGLIAQGLTAENLEASWIAQLEIANEKLLEYSSCKHLSLGTTAVALLLTKTHYYAISIGDSRLYQISDALYQITKDQTVVQNEVDLGILSKEQAEQDSRRNVLLQCVGVKTKIEPEFYWGSYSHKTVFLLCTDGYRHVVTPQELYENLKPSETLTEEQMFSNLTLLLELNKIRNETDNITALAVRLVP
jgi:serine/threonine protein phosphatase PrpC